MGKEGGSPAEVKDMETCKNCGQQITEKDKVCPNCGFDLQCERELKREYAVKEAALQKEYSVMRQELQDEYAEMRRELKKPGDYDPVESKHNASSVAGFVMGLASFLTGFNLILAVVAIVFSCAAARVPHKNRPFARAGMVLGICSVVFFLLLLALCLILYFVAGIDLTGYLSF